MKINFFIIILALLSNISYAKDIWPYGCMPYTRFDDCIKLKRNKSDPNQLLIIKNDSEHTVVFSDETDVTNENRTQLSPNELGVIALKQKPIDLCCIESSEYSEQFTPCKDMLTMCMTAYLPGISNMPKDIVFEFKTMHDLLYYFKALNIPLIAFDN